MLKTTGETFTANVDGKQRDVIVYLRDVTVTRKVDIASLKDRKADLEKELEEVNGIILEILAQEA